MSVMDQHQSQQLAFDLDNHTDDVPQSFTDDAKQETTNVVTAAPFYPHTICIRPQVFNTPNFYIDSQGYMMVKYCFQGNEIVDECYDGHFTNDFSKTLPVTSRLTGLTYLNRFCFMCNEGDVINETVADVWDVMIVHFDNNYDHRFILHPDEFIHHIRVSWKGYINIHFVPRIRNVTQQCEMYDVISCNQTGLWETYDKNVEMVCHNGHSLPILHRISSGYNKLRFKNIACVYCNVGDSFNSDTTLSCGYRPTTTTSHSFSQTLNLRLEDMVKENDKIRGKEYVSNTARAILPIPNAGAKTPCLSGYIALLVNIYILLLHNEY